MNFDRVAGVCRGSLIALALAWGTTPATWAQQPPAAQPAKAKGRAITDRYPLKYPPTLSDGGTSAVEETAEFLKPGPNLREGVEIARTPPKVEFSFYPEQNYPGNPWSHRSDGFVKKDKYYSSSNDHLAPRGTAHLWEYDAAGRKFRLLCDTTKFLESVGAFPESMNYRPGEMQSRIDLGSDGWLYYATDRGSPTATHDGNGYLGEWILRTNPQTLKTEIVITHPIAKHTIPATVLDPQRMILYCGTAPGKDSPNQNVQFFALDVKNRKILKVDEEGGPTRTLIFSPSTGYVFWGGKKYDPRTNEITPANVPHVRSCSQETPQGIVYGTSQTKAELWAYYVKTDELKQLGTAAVGKQEYIASIEADPTGRYLYYVPGAHGGASGDGTPIVQYDTRTGRRKVLAFLHDVFWEKHGYALDGSFGNALDEKGERFFISWDGWRKGQPRGWESASITVLHIPASERVVNDDKQSVLIEDDGPAAGYSYKPNEELLSPEVWIKKELMIDDPAAEKATLLIGRQAGKNGGPLEVTINGQTAKLTPAGKAGRAWEAYELDTELLKAGKNEIVLRGSGKIGIARDDEYAAGSRERTHHPNRSAKSTDGGRTWDYEHLGPKGDIDGEYYVRLFLHRTDASSRDEAVSNKEPSYRLPSNIKVIESHNPQIVRSSIPFEYEPYNHPQLAELRKKYKLDEVVDGASTEFEQICRLAAWSSQQWEKMHLSEYYPAWNALEILSPHKDGKPVGGFCQQYNLVFLQACESFGIPGRAVSIDQGALAGSIKGSGHEVVEIWSNEYRKWVYVDGNCAWYAIDEETRTPLSLWELRERQLRMHEDKPYAPIKIITLAKTRHSWDGLTSWPPFMELRMIPRSNFLAEKSPLPLNQGMHGWFWTGHYVWHDDLAPATLLYGNRVTRRSDWDWTLNQAYIELEPLDAAGQLRVRLDTQTPGFDTFIARIDDQQPASVKSGFVWKLHAGRNQLQVRPRNIAGREGIASSIVLEMQ